jgi:hypothetical protein
MSAYNITTILVAVLCTTSAFADDELPPDLSGSYLCKATASAGIWRDPSDKQWRSSTFKADNATLLKVKFTGTTGKYELLDMPFRLYEVTVKDFGSDGDGFACTVSNSEPGEYRKVRSTNDAIRCSVFATDYWFALERKKYQAVYDGGYMHLEENTDTPAIMVGICDKVDP